jgi:hypothetical protein
VGQAFGSHNDTEWAWLSGGIAVAEQHGPSLSVSPTSMHRASHPVRLADQIAMTWIVSLVGLFVSTGSRHWHWIFFNFNEGWCRLVYESRLPITLIIAGPVDEYRSH